MSKSKGVDILCHLDKTSPSLFSALRGVRKAVAASTIAIIARHLATGIRDGSIKITEAQGLLFNLNLLFFCEDHLKDHRLADIISYGMELDAVDEWVEEPGALRDACEEIEQMINRLLERPRKTVA